MDTPHPRGVRLVAAAPALFMIALGCAIFLGTSSLRLFDGVTPGARFLPVGLAGAGLLLGAALLVSASRGRDSGTLDLPDGFGWRRVLFSLAALVVVALATPVVGMVPMIAVFMLLMLLVVLRQGLVASLVTSAVVVALVEVIFVRWLAVPLPAPFSF